MSAELAAEVASLFLGERAQAVTPLVGKGDVNRIFIVRAGDTQVAVRLNDDETAVQDYAKEQWCIEQAAAKGVPGPQVLAIGKRGATAYMLQTFVIGDHGEDSQIDRTTIWRELGKYARLIHSIAVIGFGENLVDARRGEFMAPKHPNFDGTWSGFITYNVESLTESDELLKLGALTRPQSQSLRKQFEKLRDRTFRFGLNHGDLAVRNTVVGRVGQVSLLDWGSAEVHIVPHWDLIEILSCAAESHDPDRAGLQAFLDGYEMSWPEFIQMQPELAVLTALRACDKLRWAIDRHPPSIAAFTVRARQTVLQALLQA
jgi:aminoglycoside phosphotransferase (APT) family kinase protein